MKSVLAVIGLMMLGSALGAQDSSAAAETVPADQTVPAAEVPAENSDASDEAAVPDPVVEPEPVMDQQIQPEPEPVETAVEPESVEPPAADPEPVAAAEDQTVSAPEQISMSWKERLKRPMGSFLSSAVIPGTGELLQDNKKSGLIFLGVEAALWVAYAVLRSSREKKIDIYHDYAAANFNEADYQAYHTANYTSDTSFFLESLPDRDSEQYYETISHPQFHAGWDDSDYGVSQHTSVPETYLTDMQKEFNDQIDAARLAADLVQYDLTAVVFNHLISGLDAFRLAKRNENRAGLGVKYDMRLTDGEHLPWLVLEYRY